MDKGLLTTTAAASICGVSRPTWVRIATSNSLEPVTLEGSRTRWWRRGDVEKLIGAPVKELEAAS
jgi:hypothetical protein